MKSQRLSEHDRAALLQRLAAGQPPPAHLALQTLAGFDRLAHSWAEDLEGYVAGGGSLLRVLSAPVGTGKTHLARSLQALAAQRGFIVCQIDAAAQHTDDDLSLYAAFCAGLTHPQALLAEDDECGLRSILQRVADAGGGTDARQKLTQASLPVTPLISVLPGILQSLANPKRTVQSEDDIDITSRLISGEVVDGTRSLARLRRAYTGPLLKALGRGPGKRDARLWLECLLKALPALGFPGVVWILDEHDEANQRVMDRHIVQLRRLADRLTEGRLAGSFVVYLVLEDFPSRIRAAHGALDQRLRPVLNGPVPGRVMVPLNEVRDLESTAFLGSVAERIHGLTEGVPIQGALKTIVDQLARQSKTLGGVDTRRFVQSFATHLNA